MKKFSFLLTAILMSLSLLAQAPMGINYQTIIRDSDGQPLANTGITLKMTIRANTANGEVVYTETHAVVSNTFGLVNLVIGQGTPQPGEFSSINWGTANHFLETAIDLTGSGQFQVLGVMQFLSVPYAKYADNSGFSANSGFSTIANGIQTMTEQQRNAIENPPVGMQIFNSTTNCLNYFNGAAWLETCGSLVVNQPPAVPSNPAPPDNATDQLLVLNLSWVCSDRENDALAFDIYFGTTNPPDLQQSGISGFIYPLSQLQNSTSYYWKIVAHDDKGNITEGPVWMFNTLFEPILGCGDLLIDSRDSQSYTTVQIGTQCWMAQNLNVGTMIPGANEMADDGLIEKYCYDNTEANCDVYGGLYQWNEMMEYSTSEGIQGICPAGWHLPTDAEWCTITTYLDATVNCSTPGWSGTNAGGKMKETGVAHWASPNIDATNSSGFTGLPGGYLYSGGSFIDLGHYGEFSSSTEVTPMDAWTRYLGYDYSVVDREVNGKGYGYSVRCLQDASTSSTTPTITTSSISNITQTTATSGGDVTSDGGATITERGVCWSTNANPTTNDSHTTDGEGTGVFESNLTDLIPNTLYFVRAYATNSVGTAYGEEVSFTTLSGSGWQCGAALLDTRDNQTYTTVQIGTQCWMAQNLNIGNMIPGTNEMVDDDVIEKYCYDNSEANCDVYGGLYQWDEMMQYSTTQGIQGICPTGWHLPSDAEWTSLTTYLGGEDVAGGKMKETGTTHWPSPNTGATNSSGFTALPGGYRNSDEPFFGVSGIGFWWSSSEYNASDAWGRILSYQFSSVSQNNYGKSYGFSVRCLRDASTTSTTPTITTTSISNITQTTATSGGDVTSDGGATVTERGVCWSTNANPTTTDSRTMDGEGTGVFESNLADLTPNTLYFVRAYATNSVGTAYGEEVSFTTQSESSNGIPCPGTPTVTYGGQTYTTVQIGTQCWMAQNLNIGTMIPGANEMTDDGTIEKYCYDNTEANCDVYGGLYQWNEMMQYSTAQGVKGICPEAWHLPTDAEWTNLTTFLGGESVAGGKMKSTGTLEEGTGLWYSPNTGATNSSGFTALPAGSRFLNDSFGYFGAFAFFWSSSQENVTDARNLYPAFTWAGTNRAIYEKLYGFSVRCLKDATTTSTTPTITTASISNITQTTATGGGDVTSDGGATVTERGVCWSTNANPTTADSHTTDGEGTGVFESNLTDLTANTLYFVKAYATNSVGTAYGEEVSFTTLSGSGWQCGDALLDTRDNQTYTTVQIGTQCWMAQNLNIGTMIPGANEMVDDAVIEKYCYDDNAGNCDTYGGLYQWAEVVQYINGATNETHWSPPPIGNVQGICPTGWHLPTDAEFCQMENYLDASVNCVDYGWHGTDVGGKMKEAGISHWTSPNTGATNTSGFTALPGGICGGSYGFYELSNYEYFWLATLGYGLSSAMSRFLIFDDSRIYRSDPGKVSGFSARCLRDASTSSTTPTITTTSISNITQTTVTSGGDVTSDGGATVTERGVCWSTNANPTTADNRTMDGEGTGVFESTLTDLTANTLYFVKAYATNSVGTAYGEEVSFTTQSESSNGTPCPGTPTVTYGGQTYTTVQIGTQCWMAQNLNIGTMIPGANEMTDDGTIEKYCYDNTEANCDVYGGLYQWNEMMQYSTTEGVKGICPEAWHLPTDAEWNNLTTFLGGESVAYGKMKSTGTIEEGTGLWLSPNTGATNSSGFTTLPAGDRNSDGLFFNLGYIALLWSSTEIDGSDAWYRYLSNGLSLVGRSYYSKVFGFSVRCLKDASTTSTTPTITTSSISNITQTTATSGGDVTLDGGASVTERGVCWSTNANPTTADSRTTDGEGTGVFESNLTDLTANTLYFVRAYATNSVGTAYGEEVSFTTSLLNIPGNGATDIDGNVYTSVILGNQEWFVENLKTTKYANGDAIPNVTDNSQWSGLNTGGWSWLNNDSQYENPYGKLYNWYAVDDSRNLCPTGWHVPSDAEWTTLVSYLGGETTAGGKLKSTGTIEEGTGLWLLPNTGADNSSGLTALPGGNRNIDGSFNIPGEYAAFWSSSQADATSSWFRFLFHGEANVNQSLSENSYGFSVRCLKD